MSKRTKLKNSIIQILKHNRDGSHQTKANRQDFLLSMADTLSNDGYQLDHARYITTRHIYHLHDKWVADNLSSGTKKNRMSHIRWLFRKFNREHLVPSNQKLGIPDRVYVTGKDKSRELIQQDLDRVKDPLMQHSLKAQRLFSLRFEESLKIQPYVADKGTRLFIKGSWSKGDRDRFIPILTEEQRQWIDEAKALVKFKERSLIPPKVTYKTYKSRVEKRCQRADIRHMHGHRHAYVHQRFEELTGYPCPVKGGPSKKELTKEQFENDKLVRLQLAEEVGHSRIQISRNYLD